MEVIFSCSFTFKPVHQHTQVLFLRAGFNSFYNQPVFVIGISSNQMQDLVLGLADLQNIYTGAAPKAVKVSLNDISCFLACLQHHRAGVASKLAKCAFKPTVYVAEKKHSQCWSQ